MDLRFSRVALRDITMTTPIRSVAGYDNQQLPGSLLTPSPDEEIIKQRGRRQCYSALDSWLSHETLVSCLKTPSKLKSPTKSSSPKKCPNMPTRTSPRKRLNLAEGPASPLSSPSKPKSKVRCQLVKRQRLQRKVLSKPEFETAIKGLTQSQLVEMIAQLACKHPELKQELVCELPVPDLKPLEENLNCLSHNVYKAVPYSRWGSNRDGFCYRRVCTHLNMFKKHCIEQGKVLISSQQWASVIDYVLIAWTYVNGLPDWDSPAHNNVKERCFSTLASQCMMALQKGVFDQEHYEDIKDRLEEAKDSCAAIDSCISYVEKAIKKFSI